MDLKKIFGAILTCIGIGGLIYAAILFVDSPDGGLKALIVYGVLGFIFFASGIALIRSIQDKKE